MTLMVELIKDWYIVRTLKNHPGALRKRIRWTITGKYF
jgi:hypothetical protein